MAFDFKKRVPDAKDGKKRGGSPAQNAPLTNKCGLRIMWAAGMKFSRGTRGRAF